MLLLQLTLLIFGIYCPIEIRLAYFTHILILCLYLLLIKKYRYLIFLGILLISLMFSWANQVEKLDVESSSEYQLEISKFETHSEFEHTIKLVYFKQKKSFLRKLFWLGQGQVAITWFFDEKDYFQHLGFYSANSVTEKIQVKVERTLLANKHGNAQQRQLYRYGLKGQIYLYALNWTNAQKTALLSSSKPMGLYVQDALDKQFAGFETWPYTRSLVLGNKDQLSQKDLWLIKSLGLMHLFVVSGLHIGFVYFIVFWLSRWVWHFSPANIVKGIQHQAVLTLFLLVPTACFYAAITGWGESVQRAVWMLLLWQVFNLLGLKISAYKVLLIALYGILLLDENALDSVGLWLSFTLVLILLVFFEYQTSHLLQTMKLQFILTLCATTLILGWQASISSGSVLINLLVLPLTAFLWFPVAILASVESLLLHTDYLMSGLDYVLVAALGWLEASVYLFPSLLLKSGLLLYFKVLLYLVFLLWVIYRHRVRSWVFFPILVLLIILFGPIDVLVKKDKSVVSVAHQSGSLMLDNGVEPQLSSLWINNVSELSLMWLDPFLFDASNKDASKVKILLWPFKTKGLTSSLLVSLSPRWLIFKHSPKQSTMDLLSAMQVSWLVLPDESRVTFEWWRNQWVIKHSNCLIFFISKQENNCLRVAELESVLNYSPKF